MRIGLLGSCYSPAMKILDSTEFLERARKFAGTVAERADEIDEGRRIPADLAGDMADAGMFRLLVPKSVGGSELDYPTFVKIVRAFAEADASVAWCVSQNNIFSTDASRMPVETAKEIWGEPRGIVTNGPPSPDTIAVPTLGGYRLTGHWDFSSGSSHSTWLAARSPVEGVSGEPRMFIVPKSDVTMIDRWQVNGLRGTASFSFEANDVFVSESHTYLESDAPREKSAIYTIPKIPLFAVGFATISLALARACLDDATELARQKTQRMVAAAMVDRSTVHQQIGETEAKLRSADAFVRNAAKTLWDSTCESGVVDMDQRIEVRMASTYAIRQAVEVVDIAYEMFGAGAIFKSNLIQRRWQDVHTIAQQIQGRATNFETAGRYFLGLGATGML
jgi:alkylation response protein AidB-like acyl-CoA dehydrogenase